MLALVSHSFSISCSTASASPHPHQLLSALGNGQICKFLTNLVTCLYLAIGILLRIGLTLIITIALVLASAPLLQVAQAAPAPYGVPYMQAQAQQAQGQPIPATPYVQAQYITQPAVYVTPNGQVSTTATLGQMITDANAHVIAYNQNQQGVYPTQYSQSKGSIPAQYYQTTSAQYQQWTNSAFPLATSLDATDLALLKELSKAQNSKSAKLNSKPFISKPGEVSFIYGASQPTVVCSLLHVCDIALEPSENVVDVKVGDSARWIVERSASGSSEGIVEHITLKPTDTNLQSNLRIYTDRRAYSIDLKSATQDFMPSVTFVYPEKTLQKYAQVKAQLQQQQAAQARNTIHMGQQAFSLTDLNFNYEIEGDKTIKPLRVFNDTRKTYIQMSPQLMRQNRLPALVVVHDPGGFFSDAKTAMINYRIIDNNFVVDGIPTHLRLILGQDSDQAASVDIKLQNP